ncbi:TIGR03084 family protein [Asanoa ishikariensis]|uniref:TIGR03084 family protein n=1 Tax=Asanoa ishikariensis TaxID=137265 RepID=A0A1H3UXA2_9ACTN|nr:TIGR03084 family metal-binding protein [Asanoa ishikariensis]GIF65157.1 TIGR03084 family protein [Asanoa ishikariensis]SDZ66445.1 TIGR03084 family protein [Asanoa ishikariensis]
MVELAALLTDLDAETAEVDALVKDRPRQDWDRPTPSAGWTVAHQIAHLAWTDHAALLATTDDAQFVALLAPLADDPDRIVDKGAEGFLAPPDELRQRWLAGHRELVEALRAAPPGKRIPWFGNLLAPQSMVTARLMETWAHGLDIADALGVVHQPTQRLRHVAFLGFRTLGHSFLAHGQAVPSAPVRVELIAPDGSMWAFGPEAATDRLTGPALDFCLLVTQRRHPKDLALIATGPVATEWLGVAQAFAGPPGAKREPVA